MAVLDAKTGATAWWNMYRVFEGQTPTAPPQ
jgi:hypothetical protein